MKRFFYATALAFFVAFATSCSSDDSNEVTNNDTEATITAVINGEEWTGTVTSSTLLKVSSMGLQRFDITAEDGEQRIQLACESEIQVGMPLITYTFDEESMDTNAIFTNSYLLGGNSYMEHFVSTGEMTFTAFDAVNGKASGTFSFTAYKVGTLQDQIVTPEDVIITNGVFTNVSYTLYEQ